MSSTTQSTARGSTRDAKHVPLTQAQRLRQDAEAAAEVRRLSNHPDVIALRVEKVRAQVDAMIWAGIFLGLAFTMVNVQSFAAAGAAAWSLPWLAAWLLDPMVSVVLVAVLRAEQITARYQVSTGRWAHRTKWFAFLATYVMNTWQSWAAGHLAGIVLHSVPPVLVFLAAETAPVLRDRLTEAVMRAAGEAFTGTTEAPTGQPVNTAPADPAWTALEPREHHRAAPPKRRKAPAVNTGGRKLLADYVTDARAMWTPGTEVTPAWARQATGCSRGLSSKVAAALRDELALLHTTTARPAGEFTDAPVGEREAA